MVDTIVRECKLQSPENPLQLETAIDSLYTEEESKDYSTRIDRERKKFENGQAFFQYLKKSGVELDASIIDLEKLAEEMRKDLAKARDHKTWLLDDDDNSNIKEIKNRLTTLYPEANENSREIIEEQLDNQELIRLAKESQQPITKINKDNYESSYKAAIDGYYANIHIMRKLINKMKEYLPIGERDSEWVKGVGIPVMNFHADFCEKLEQTLEAGYSVQSEVIGEFAQKSCKNVLDSSGYTKERNDLRQILTDLTLITGKNYTDLTTKGGIKGAIDKDISELREQQKEEEARLKNDHQTPPVDTQQESPPTEIKQDSEKEKLNVSPIERIKARLQGQSDEIERLNSDIRRIEEENAQLLAKKQSLELENERTKDENTKIEDTKSKTSKELRDKIAENRELDKKERDQRLKSTRLEQKVKDLQREIGRLKQDIQDLQEKRKLLEQKDTSQQGEIKELLGQQKETEQTISQLRSELAKQESENTELATKIQKLTSKNSREKAQVQLLQDAAKQHQQKQREQEKQLGEANTTIGQLHSELDEQTSENTELTAKVQELTSENSREKAQVQLLQDAAEQHQQKQREQEKQLGEANTTIGQLHSELDKQTSENTELAQDVQKHRSRIHELESINRAEQAQITALTKRLQEVGGQHEQYEQEIARLTSHYQQIIDSRTQPPQPYPPYPPYPSF